MVIYSIRIVGIDRFYIGSAINFEKRKSAHLSKLRRRAHANKHLQRVFDKCGEDKLEFTILETIASTSDSKKDKFLLLETEQKWIDKFHFSLLLNMCPVAGNTMGRRHGQEAKNKISDNHADVSGANNPMFGKTGELSPNYGKPRNLETRKKISEATKGRKSWCDGIKRPEHSNKMMGESNPFYGKSHNEETKKLLSEKKKESLRSRGGKKLTFELAAEIRQRYNEGNISISALARCYGLSRNFCSQLLKGVYWNDEERTCSE